MKSIQAFGAILVHSFMKKYWDVDQSTTLVKFRSGALGNVEGSRNSAYGYDIRSEVIGSEGSIQIGSIQYGENTILTKNKSYMKIFQVSKPGLKTPFYLNLNIL